MAYSGTKTGKRALGHGLFGISGLRPRRHRVWRRTTSDEKHPDLDPDPDPDPTFVSEHGGGQFVIVVRGAEHGGVMVVVTAGVMVVVMVGSKEDRLSLMSTKFDVSVDSCLTIEDVQGSRVRIEEGTCATSASPKPCAILALRAPFCSNLHVFNDWAWMVEKNMQRVTAKQWAASRHAAQMLKEWAWMVEKKAQLVAAKQWAASRHAAQMLKEWAWMVEKKAQLVAAKQWAASRHAAQRLKVWVRMVEKRAQRVASEQAARTAKQWAARQAWPHMATMALCVRRSVQRAQYCRAEERETLKLSLEKLPGHDTVTCELGEGGGGGEGGAEKAWTKADVETKTSLLQASPQLLSYQGAGTKYVEFGALHFCATRGHSVIYIYLCISTLFVESTLI